MSSFKTQNMTKTMLCRSVTGEGKCTAFNGNCKFAHTIDELRPRLCRYGDKCNKHKDHPRTCKFVHPDEDIYNYACTHGFVLSAHKPDLVKRNEGFRFSNDDFPDLKRKIDDISSDMSDDEPDGEFYAHVIETKK